MAHDGTGLRNLTQDVWQDDDPDLSPDGSMIAYETSGGYPGNVVVIDAEAGTTIEPIRVLRDGHGATWSPDGGELAWVNTYAGIVFTRLDETPSENIVDTALEPLDLAWSPNGEELAYAAKDFGQLPDPNADIYVTTLSSRATRQLTTTPTENDVMPSWSPDGQRIAFASAPRSIPATPPDIYVMDADGGNKANITNHPAWDSAPDWGVEPQPQGGSQRASQPAPTDRSPPTISRLTMSNTTFRVGPAGKTARRPRPKRGTTFRFTSSEAASVGFRFDMARKRNRCRKRRARRQCRFREVGSLRYPARAGRNRQRFQGWVGRRALAPGRYRALLQAVDPAGNRSATRSIGFRVARP